MDVFINLVEVEEGNPSNKQVEIEWVHSKLLKLKIIEILCINLYFIKNIGIESQRN